MYVCHVHHYTFFVSLPKALLTHDLIHFIPFPFPHLPFQLCRVPEATEENGENDGVKERRTSITRGHKKCSCCNWRLAAVLATSSSWSA